MLDDVILVLVVVGNDVDGTVPVVTLLLTLLAIVVLDNNDFGVLSLVIANVSSVLLGGMDDTVTNSDTPLTLGDDTVPCKVDDTVILLLVSGSTDVTL